jgi:hypothetical protein
MIAGDQPSGRAILAMDKKRSVCHVPVIKFAAGVWQLLPKGNCAITTHILFAVTLPHHLGIEESETSATP